jgi:hypothetical protein
MIPIAFITYQHDPGLSPSDALMVTPLQARGIAVQAVPWDALNVNWRTFAAVVLRSNWDYQQRPEAFRAWLQALQHAGVNLWNPPAVVLWNIDKIYLRDLKVHGVTIAPTVWLDQGQAANLATILAQNDWEQALVKPRIGASARQIWRTSRQEAPGQQQQFATCLAQQGWMVQKELPDIANGEWSLIFFGGEFCYAVLKKPAPGSIFVQARLGGGWIPADPPAHVVAQAASALATTCRVTGMATPLLYARVDGLDMNGVFHLIEMEVNEPGLMLNAALPSGPERFAEAILQIVRAV